MGFDLLSVLSVENAEVFGTGLLVGMFIMLLFVLFVWLIFKIMKRISGQHSVRSIRFAPDDVWRLSHEERRPLISPEPSSLPTTLEIPSSSPALAAPKRPENNASSSSSSKSALTLSQPHPISTHISINVADDEEDDNKRFMFELQKHRAGLRKTGKLDAIVVQNMQNTIGSVVADVNITPRSGASKSKRPPRKRQQSKEEEEMVQHQLRIVKEFMETEASYVQSLTTFIDIFARPLRERQPRIIPLEDVEALFSPMELILGINQQFLNELIVADQRLFASNTSQTQSSSNTAASDLRMLFELLSKRALAFKLYSGYVSMYLQVRSQMLTLRDTNREFDQFIQECEQNLQNANSRQTDFHQFSIMPIQRLPRYKLLLEDLMKHTPATHPDYQILENAVRTIKSIVEYVNEKTRDMEDKYRVVEIQHELRLKGLVVPSRRMVKEEAIQKIDIASDSLVECRVFLFNDLLLVYTDRSRSGKIVRFSLESACVDPLLVMTAGNALKRHAFQVRTSSGTSPSSVELVCDSEESRTTWISAIRKQIASMSPSTSTNNNNNNNVITAASPSNSL